MQALHNNKAVLRAGVKTRDGKLVGLAWRAAEAEGRTAAEAGRLARIEGVRGTLTRATERCMAVEGADAQATAAEGALRSALLAAEGAAPDLGALC